MLILLYRDPKATSQAWKQVFVRVGHDSCGVSLRHLFPSLAWATETGTVTTTFFLPYQSVLLHCLHKALLKSLKKTTHNGELWPKTRVSTTASKQNFVSVKKKRCPKEMMISTN